MKGKLNSAEEEGLYHNLCFLTTKPTRAYFFYFYKPISSAESQPAHRRLILQAEQYSRSSAVTAGHKKAASARSADGQDMPLSRSPSLSANSAGPPFDGEYMSTDPLEHRVYFSTLRGTGPEVSID